MFPIIPDTLCASPCCSVSPTCCIKKAYQNTFLGSSYKNVSAGALFLNQQANIHVFTTWSVNYNCEWCSISYHCRDPRRIKTLDKKWTRFFFIMPNSVEVREMQQTMQPASKQLTAAQLSNRTHMTTNQARIIDNTLQGTRRPTHFTLNLNSC